MTTAVHHDEHIAFHNNETVFAGKMDKHQVKDYYSGWAARYEKDLAPGRYNGPAIAAETCTKLFQENEREFTKILDVAAGTGFLGQELAKRGFREIHALDPSEGMLEAAKSKNVYKDFICEFLTKDKLHVEADKYDCVTSSEGFGQGHIPVEALHEIIRITKTGGYVVTVMREEYLEIPEYKDKLEPLMIQLDNEGKWKKVDRVVVPNYAFGKSGIIFIYQVL